MQTVVVVDADEGADEKQKSLAARVRRAIRTAGINHSEVARSIGIEPSKLSKSLAGTRKFRVEEISRIAELTEVTTDWLTSGRTAQPPRRRIVSDFHQENQAHDATVPGVTVAVTTAEEHPGLRSEPDSTWMSKGTRNRRKIVAAAWELYADRGIDKVRTEDVARACGMTTSAINYHFRTKTQLLQAALRYSLEIIGGTRELRDPADPVAALRHFAKVHAGVDGTVRRVWSIWIQSWSAAASDEHTRLNLTAVYTEWLDMVTGVILAGQREGTIRMGNTALIVKSLSIFIDGLGVARSTAQMPVTDDEAMTMLEDYLTAHVLTKPHSQEEGT
ncbi:MULTISPECIES: TetR/AcrR family transcriptional regulator [unclassified Brevibacterium]|uniref:TetR/AcrR family transcriptional regulator n=1 Tax=unclassified Brevibacterium TaxID=2614124 RepID=UPI001E495091|nr:MULTISPECIES: TetR/AcrR family transcriptional regulator [unclassified Brevibacterium]MDK8434596.1 TetR family transcriptional regulator [Brevibacterium sp. H-BE7]